MVIIYSETWERPVFSKEGRLELLLTVERVIIPDCGTTGLRIFQFCISLPIHIQLHGLELNTMLLCELVASLYCPETLLLAMTVVFFSFLHH